MCICFSIFEERKSSAHVPLSQHERLCQAQEARQRLFAILQWGQDAESSICARHVSSLSLSFSCSLALALQQSNYCDHRFSSKDKTDIDVIREEMRFIWDDDEAADSWEKRLAKRYYDKLYKEYCICDLTLFKQNKVSAHQQPIDNENNNNNKYNQNNFNVKIAMRWRIEKEVLDGKGQFVCGDKKCSCTDGLKSWEVNFGYMEHGEKKNALVKLSSYKHTFFVTMQISFVYKMCVLVNIGLCPDCSFKLNFHHQ